MFVQDEWQICAIPSLTHQAILITVLAEASLIVFLFFLSENVDVSQGNGFSWGLATENHHFQETASNQ